MYKLPTTLQPFPNGSPAIIYHPCVEQIAKRYGELDRAIERGKVDVSSAVSAYAHVVKGNTLGLARLASAVPTSANDGEMSIPFILTTLQEDRDGDVVIPMGCQLDEYQQNPVIFFGHQSHPIPIATAKSPDGRLAVYPEENLIRGVAYFDKADADAVFIYGKVKRGFLNATSIAFVPIQAVRRDREQEKGLYSRGHTHSDPGAPAGWIFKTYSLTEWSIVGVPSNAGAIRDSLDTEKSFISPKLQKAMLPYAAKAQGRCFSGWCPTPEGVCVPCGEKSMQQVAKKLDVAAEAAALKKMGDDAIRELQSLKDGSPKQSDAAKRLTDEVTRYMDQLAGRVTSAADAKRLAQALGRSGTESGKDNLLKGIRLAIIGRIGSYVRVHASFEGGMKKNLCGCKDAKVGQECSCKKSYPKIPSNYSSFPSTMHGDGSPPGTPHKGKVLYSPKSRKQAKDESGNLLVQYPKLRSSDPGPDVLWFRIDGSIGQPVGKSIKSYINKAKNELPGRPVEPICERTLRETFNGDTRVTQLPEWDAWKRAVHHQYVELRTADERLTARPKFERTFADLKAAYARLPKKSLRKSPSVLNNAIRQAISAGYSQVQDYAGDWNELGDWIRSQKQGWDWESAQVSGNKLVAVDDGGVRYTFALRKSKKQLLESSGPAGGYTVAVEQGTEAISTAGDVVCSQCTGSGNCPGCGGVGEFNDMPCDACGGSGGCSMCSGQGVQEKPTKGTNVATRKIAAKSAVKKGMAEEVFAFYDKSGVMDAAEYDSKISGIKSKLSSASKAELAQIWKLMNMVGPTTPQKILAAIEHRQGMKRKIDHIDRIPGSKKTAKASRKPAVCKAKYVEDDQVGNLIVLWDTQSNKYYVNSVNEINQDHHLAGPFPSQEAAFNWARSNQKSAKATRRKSAEEVAVVDDKELDDPNPMPFTPKPSALEAAKAYQHLKDLADYYGPGGDGDLEKMDHPGMSEALKDFLEDDLPKAMEKIKSSILTHHKSDDDPEAFMEKLCKALGGADEFETGEAGMVENGDVPPVVEDDFNVEEDSMGKDELLDEEESDGEIDKSEVGSEEWAEEEAAEPQHKEEEEVVAEYEDGDDTDPDTEEILERYQHPKSGKWMTRKVGTARRAKDGNVYITRKDLTDPGSEDGAGDEMTDEGNPEELKAAGDEVDDVEMSLDNEGNPEELKAAKSAKPRPVSTAVERSFTDFKKTLSRLGVKLNGSRN